MSKTFVGSRLAEFLPGLEALPITKVELLNENGDIVGEAGDSTGRTLTAVHPDGSAAMAADILASVKGFVYRPYEGTDALIDPATELGDGVTVGGIYSVLACEDINFDSLYSAGIKAPASDEIEDEYPYKSPFERKVERNLAYTRALIAKSTGQILLKVEGTDGKGGLTGQVAQIETSLKTGIKLEATDGTTSSVLKMTINDTEVASAEIKLTGVVTFEALSGSPGSGQTKINGGWIDADTLTLNGKISFDDLTADVQDDINDAYVMAEDAEAAVGEITYTYKGKTYIDEDCIMAGSVIAGSLMGGRVGLLDSDEDEVGSIEITYTQSGYGLEISTDIGGIRINAGGNFWVDADYGSMGITSSGLVSDADLVPQKNNIYTCGAPGLVWSAIYADTGEVNTSDRNKKNSIDYDLDRYEPLYDGLMPCSFKLNGGTSDRRHTGLVSQDVEDLFPVVGLTSQDLAAFIKSPREGGYEYGLRYSEFVALNIWQIQKLKARVDRGLLCIRREAPPEASMEKRLQQQNCRTGLRRKSRRAKERVAYSAQLLGGVEVFRNAGSL